MDYEILLDVNVVVDILAQRKPHLAASLLAFNEAVSNNNRIWLYSGSVQTLHYVLAKELKRAQPVRFNESLTMAKRLVHEFSSYIQWLRKELCYNHASFV